MDKLRPRHSSLLAETAVPCYSVRIESNYKLVLNRVHNNLVEV